MSSLPRLLPRTLLARTLLRENLYLLALVLGVGLGVYVFIDLFDRLDDFLDAGVSAGTIAAYYLFRLPNFIARIFPAVFLLAMMIQLGLMLRNRELLALEACAVPPMAVTRALLWYALGLVVVQFTFSEVLGVQGHKAGEQIWNEQVRNLKAVQRRLPDIWFREGGAIVHMDFVTPLARSGEGLTVHLLDPDAPERIREIIRARSFMTGPDGWKLSDVTRTIPDSYLTQNATQLTLDLKTDVAGFLIVDPKASLQSLPLWQLGSEIARLRDSGSNIERLQTAWHMKLAYAGSVVVMALIALAMVSTFSSLFVIVPAGLVMTFCYYGFFVMCVSAGEKGMLPPALAAWVANIFFCVASGTRLALGHSFRLGRM